MSRIRQRTVEAGRRGGGGAAAAAALARGGAGRSERSALIAVGAAGGALAHIGRADLRGGGEAGPGGLVVGHHRKGVVVPLRRVHVAAA